mmetsp:Transcript_4676/g.7077  ORF Transcript_4676/g.7077 Transcript_4676/m.7077 type:complete len:97 (+) Transcript_4676:271-561(+)
MPVRAAEQQYPPPNDRQLAAAENLLLPYTAAQVKEDYLSFSLPPALDSVRSALLKEKEHALGEAKEAKCAVEETISHKLDELQTFENSLLSKQKEL